MSGGVLARLPKPIATVLKGLWMIMLSAGALALGGFIGKKLLEPRWEPVISYSGSLCFLILLLANPTFGFLLWIVVAPYFGFALLHISLGRGIPDLSLSRLVLVVLVGLLAAQLATGRRKLIPVTRVDFLAVLSLIGIGISILSAISKGPSLAWFFETFLMPVLTYFVARYLITDERRMIGAQRAIILVGISIALVVLQEQLMGKSWFPTVGSTAYGKHLRRVTGLLGNPAFLAVTTAMALPFTWRAMIQNPIRGRRRLLLLCLGLMYVGLFLTYNRAGWAGAVAGILVFLLFYPRFRKPFFKLVPLVALPIAIYWTQISSSYGYYAFRERLLAANPVAYRLESYKLAWRVFVDNPAIGLGFGNLWYLAGKYAAGSTVSLDYLITPHNTFLWVLISAGLVGFIPYAGTFLMMAWDSWRLYCKAPRVPGLDRELLVSFWAALVAYAGQVFAVDMLYGIYPNIVFFFIAGSVFGYQEAVIEKAKREAQAVQPAGAM